LDGGKIDACILAESMRLGEPDALAVAGAHAALALVKAGAEKTEGRSMTTNAMIFLALILIVGGLWGLIYAIRKQSECMREQKKRHYKVRNILTREGDDVLDHCYELLEEGRKRYARGGRK
jgi:hypothetical protein